MRFTLYEVMPFTLVFAFALALAPHLGPEPVSLEGCEWEETNRTVWYYGSSGAYQDQNGDGWADLKTWAGEHQYETCFKYDTDYDGYFDLRVTHGCMGAAESAIHHRAPRVPKVLR